MGDRVRISKTRRKFHKAYLPSWTRELFTVNKILDTVPVTYNIRDDHGDVLEGSFYEQEIQKVKDDNVFRIERILKKTGKNFFVKWLGYDNSFNSWIPETAIIKFQ